MGDNNKGVIAQEQTQNEDKVFEITVVWHEKGIGVKGNCVQNEMVALYLLEKAKDTVKHINRPTIIRPKFSVGLRGAFGKRIAGGR